ncbi:RNA-binding protein [Verticillium alfalfae VaMs.102]|uniref:RNA-binding protein n=1 Tax=Verticillium alfalfae (strain VaMs.102 / ATCC MYA-4576 / FGSC 10136) TaxID=526221 RepID=C9SJZ3_VERA1|nr:RNA-binding protein [Verticillium alfalfae VaMs.102]EEY19011.1 RNA-binding protein [Verticillium alfalfae VaMs.102]
MATSSSFSYAQAAKGQAPNVTSATTTQSASAPEDHIADIKDAIKNQSAADEQSPKSNDASPKDQRGEEASAAEQTDSAPAQESTPASTAPTDMGSASAPALNGTGRDDDETTTETSHYRSDKSAARSSSSSTRVTDENDGKKASARSEGSSQALRPAGAQTTAAKAMARLPRPKRGATRRIPRKSPNLPTLSTLPRPVPPRLDLQTVSSNQERLPRRFAPRARHRGGPGARGSRAGDKADALPPVGDATFWPTPETAIKDDKRKPAEKTERTEQPEAHDDSAGQKSREKKQWSRMDFVPTVNFETPVPAMRGSRGGGRNGRGGRDVSTRGGGNATSASAADRSSEAPAGNAVKGGSDQREKSKDGAAPSRPTSVPPSTTRHTEATRPRESRKNASRPKDASAGEHTGPRGDGRGERGGRGGYRGRGGHQNVPPHNQQGSFNANAGAFAAQPVPSRHQQFTSPPLPQGNSFPQSFGSARPSGRGGNRQSTASNYSHRTNGNGNRPRPISTSGNMGYTWDSYPNMPMTAPVYPPQQAFDFHVKPVLTQQVDFYFSLENLCKDLHLRKNMDSQGFVALSLIHGFQRVFQLCGPNLHLLRAAVAESTTIDYVVGKDGLERVRARDHWQKFVLPTDQRSEAAQTDGPESFHSYSLDQQAIRDPAATDYPLGSPPLYVNGINGHGYDGLPLMNGAYHGEANGQLSAAVPDFQPSSAFADQHQEQVNGDVNGTTPAAQAQVNGTHGESQVEALQS